MTAPLTILGAGLAGYNLARELRKHAPDLPLRIICADAGDFYSKPMLSSALSSKKQAADLVMKPRERMVEELGAEILAHTAIHAIDRKARHLLGPAGTYEYERLVLALGADAIVPGLAGDGGGQVLQVNDLGDYARFRGRLESARRVLVIGAGLVGCEFAHDLASQGWQVSVLDQAATPLARLLPEAAGRFLQAGLTALGVQFVLGRAVHAVEQQAAGVAVLLDDGSRLEADLVLSAIGLRPRTTLAAATGLAVGRGIQVNALLQTSDPAIYALGDCAEVEGRVLPYVMPIMHGARALAATLAGKPAPLRYPAMPVLVKTPSCPTVICPPADGVAGAWQVDASASGVCALFQDEAGQLQGFALLGDTGAQRQALLAQMPA